MIPILMGFNIQILIMNVLSVHTALEFRKQPFLSIIVQYNQKLIKYLTSAENFRSNNTHIVGFTVSLTLESPMF